MEPLDLIRDKFSQDCTIETVLHLLMAHFDMTEEQAQTEIDSYFEIVDWTDKHCDTLEEDLGYAKNHEVLHLKSTQRSLRASINKERVL